MFGPRTHNKFIVFSHTNAYTWNALHLDEMNMLDINGEMWLCFDEKRNHLHFTYLTMTVCVHIVSVELWEYWFSHILLLLLNSVDKHHIFKSYERKKQRKKFKKWIKHAIIIRHIDNAFYDAVKQRKLQ